MRVHLPEPEATAIVPGSFDPITNGHVDIIERAARLFDRVVVGVLVNIEKSGLFTAEERVGMVQELFAHEPRIEVASFEGLLVDFAHRRGAGVVVRGIRAVSDYEYELQMALMNRRLAPDVETIFLLPKEENSFISSRLAKEVCRFGGDTGGILPPAVAERVKQKFGGRS